MGISKQIHVLKILKHVEAFKNTLNVNENKNGMVDEKEGGFTETLKEQSVVMAVEKAFIEWLEKKVGLGIYLDSFTGNGCAIMATIPFLNESTLKNIC